MSLWFWPLADLGEFFRLPLWCFLVTTCWSLIWNSLLIVPVSFQLLFFIHLSSLTLVAFLIWFLLLFLGNTFWSSALFHFVHKSSRLFFLNNIFFEWVLKKFWTLSLILGSLFFLFLMFSSHYLLITDFKPLADCPGFVPAFVFHQAFIFEISWIWPFCGILACLLMFFWYFYGLLLDHRFEPRFRMPITRFNWVSPNSNLTDSISVLLWPFWWILSSLLMFLWCFDSLIFDHWFEIIVFSSIRFNSLFHLWFFPLRIISTFFDVLPNVCGFLWFFLWSIHFDLWYETSIADCW